MAMIARGAQASTAGAAYADSMAFESVTAARPSLRPPVVPLVRRVLLLLAAVWTAANVDPVLPSINGAAHWVADGFATSESIAFFGLTSLGVYTLALVLAGVVAITALRYARVRRHVAGATVPLRVDEQGLHLAGHLALARPDVASAEVAFDARAGFALMTTSREGLVLRVPLSSDGDAHAAAQALSVEHDPSALVFEGVADARSYETRAAMVATAVIAVLATAHLIAVPYLTTSWIRQLAPAPRHWGQHPELLQYWLLWLQRFSALPVGALSVFAVGAVVRRVLPGRVRVDAGGLRLGGAKGRDIARDELAGVESVGSSGAALSLRDGTRVLLGLEPGRLESERDELVNRVRSLVAATSLLRARLVDPPAQLAHEPLDGRPALGG
jgi:hypothetical protein